MITEKLLFVMHGGQIGNSRAAIIMSGHCLPIACSHASWCPEGITRPVSEMGIYALWESTTDVEEFFGDEGLSLGEGIKSPKSTNNLPVNWKPEGLYVYEISYDPQSIVNVDEISWEHLQGGELRRPTIEELEPLTKGLPPWGGIVL